MNINKTRWQDLGLTPRQLSKKIGVTYSMAEFITQSYRIPVQIKVPQDARICSPPCKRKCPRKNQCTYKITCKSRCEETPGFAAPSTSCSRKRERSEEQRRECEDPSSPFAWTKTKKVYESEESLCSLSRSNKSSKDRCKSPTSSCCSSSCGQICASPTAFQKAKCSRGKRRQKHRRKSNAGVTCKATVKCSSTEQPSLKKRRIVPIDIHLNVPLNIFLDNEDGIELENEVQQPCNKWKNRSPCVQVPSVQEDDNCGLKSGACQRPEHRAELWKEESDDQEEIEMDECVPCEDSSSEGKESCRKPKVGDSCQVSWWERIQECMLFLESLLSSIVNKCPK
ncbi:Hypothetical predicted protein [Podarcis lilfordi]|uniref:Uncharacterized protein n=1 Tax=Podarcis lilfordi TaxID=74358 RepID=A0AA35LGB0_9SAUR|nr:Hypothetical predicted protein [Podarcis lilfordi]